MRKAGQVLQRRGGNLLPENIQKQGKKTGVTLYTVGWCNWYDMATQLIWYHETEEYIEQPKPRRSTKPRKSMYESQEEHKRRVAE